MTEWRVGHGYDVHAFAAGRKLILGGVEIPSERGLLGHSDADVLVHAIMDALLGALALGDIGKLFPDTDDRFRGISSMKLLSVVSNLLKEKNAVPANVDATVVLESPKIGAYIPEMVRRIAAVLCVDESRVNVKATTEEHLGFTGKGEGAAAHAVCMLQINN